jgi:hypothetical protein
VAAGKVSARQQLEQIPVAAALTTTVKRLGGTGVAWVLSRACLSLRLLSN